MSEKTLGEVKRYLVCSYGDMMEHADGRWCLFEKAQAAADAIAAPLLARIAELEGEVESQIEIGDSLLADALGEMDRRGKEITRLSSMMEGLERESNWWLQKELAAYQRGVAEERERILFELVHVSCPEGSSVCNSRLLEFEATIRKEPTP